MFNKIIKLVLCLLIKIVIKIKKLLHIKYTTLRLKSGLILKIRNIDIVGSAVLMKHFELVTQQSIMSSVCNGMTVLDIGANFGYFTVLMAKAVGETGRVIAFEPNPVMLEELRKNIEVNNFKNVIVVPMALSNQSGYVSLYCPNCGSESYGSLKPNNNYTVKEAISVEVEKLDNVLAKLGCSNVDFVKIDVEGAEYSIFQGAESMLRVMKPKVIFECAESLCSAFGHNVFDVLNLLNNTGYKVTQLDYGMWLATVAEIQGDSLTR